jgi:ribonuclease HI
MTSIEALCILTGATPIDIKAEETVKLYRSTRDRQNHQLGNDVQPKDWRQLADSVRINERIEGKEHTIQIFTDGSNNEQGVGSGIAIYIQNILTHQIKHKLHDRCSNNQAEQITIIRALEAIETTKISSNFPRTIMIHTDSRITLESLRNMKNRTHLLEEIRKKTIELERENWKIESLWIKAHAGHYRNELANKLTKEATGNHDVCYNKIPKSKLEHQEREKSIEKWQQQLNNFTKGTVTKEFFPNIKDRPKMKIHLTPNFTAMVTAHGKTRSYLYRFKLTVSPECPCSNGNQTVDHLIYACSKLNNERQKLVAHISKEDNWPIGKSELVNKYLTQVIQFTNSVDYDKL